ncbi:MAG: DUF3823 domain-containing protein [Bacteroidota bacterium]|nr:DUF3823 domain-containing protein [Bacteroidota bacterium]
MKNSLRYILISMVALSFFACKKDNYSEPGTFLTGSLMYKGDSVQVERNQVPYQIYQYGFGKVGAINGTFEQDGSYSQVLYDGNYKLIIPNGQGPFLWNQTSSGAPDSLAITLKGNQSVNLEVTPYYMVRNTKISVAGGVVSATFKAEQIITDPTMAKSIERVSLYINKTQFVSGGDNIALMDLAGTSITDPNNISLSVTIPALVPTQKYVFARVGIKITNVEDMIFSPLQKISF